MRVYVAGSISEHAREDNNSKAFAERTAKLRALGHEVINPIELDKESKLEGAATQNEWNAALIRDILIVVKCDAITLLPGWERSDGGEVEVFNATKLGKLFIDEGGQIVPKQNILEKANSITGGYLPKTMGHPVNDLQRTAELWSVFLGIPIKAQDVALMGILKKTGREKERHRDKNLLDIAGNARCIEILRQENQDIRKV